MDYCLRIYFQYEIDMKMLLLISRFSAVLIVVIMIQLAC